MKRLLAVVGVICALGQLLEYLALPAIFAVVGVLNAFPWQYYAITIGGYFGVIILGESMVWLIFHALGKAYRSRLVTKTKKIVQRVSGKKQNSAAPTQEEN